MKICGVGCTSYGHDATRHDLVLSIPLADYLAVYGEAEAPTPHSHKTSRDVSPRPVDLLPEEPTPEVPGVAYYSEYSARWVGTVPHTSPPVHVWVKASTATRFVPDAPATERAPELAIAGGAA